MKIVIGNATAIGLIASCVAVVEGTPPSRIDSTLQEGDSPPAIVFTFSGQVGLVQDVSGGSGGGF
jgi:hypothetical protein